jgi:hypothetical protein
MLVNAEEGKYTNNAQLDVETLCHAGESIYFSCKTRKGKIISLCGTKTENGDTYLYYRFGKRDNIEMEYPDAWNKEYITKFSYIRRSRAQLDDVSVLFRQGGYEYNLYSYYDGERSDKKFYVNHGIIVGKVNGGNVKNHPVDIKCANELIDHLILTTYFLPCNEKQEYSCDVEFDEYGKPVGRKEKARRK